MQTEQQVTFDRYRLDLASEQLWCGSAEIPLPGKAFALLRYLQHAPTWLVQMPTLLPAAELETLQRQTQGVTRERMLREMGDAIAAITIERPLVLWLEDLHWSDASTVELLALLARRREPARLLVIGTYRPVDVIVQEHPLRAVKQVIREENSPEIRPAVWTCCQQPHHIPERCDVLAQWGVQACPGEIIVQSPQRGVTDSRVVVLPTARDTDS